MRSKSSIILKFHLHLKGLKFLTVAMGIFLSMCACSGVAERKQENDNSIEHCWDKYDFTDTLLTAKPEVIEPLLKDYLIRLSELTEEEACGSLRKLVARTKVDERLNRWLLQRLEHYLYEPDSPLRNDNYYISVLEEALSTGYMKGMMRVRPLYQLKMLRKNQAGSKATDIHFTLSSGKTENLWGVTAAYTLLLFYDPSCAHCQESIRQLTGSPVIETLSLRGGDVAARLALVTICTEGDMDVWKEFQKFLPSTWVNGYDARNELMESEAYFLRSLPAIYLLGEDKQVLLKEASIDEVINYLLNEYDNI